MNHRKFDNSQEHFTEITQHEEFIRLPPDEVKKILNSDDLNVPNEEVVFHVSNLKISKILNFITV